VNDNPPVVKPAQKFRIDGGVRNVVGPIAASDADDANEPGFTHLQDWTIVSGDPGRAFDIDEGNGALRVVRPTAVDFRRSSYTLTLNVGDGENTSAPESLTVTIPDRVTVCLLIVELQVPKKAAPPLLKLGASLGRCRAR
jgi:hypothetical protein